MLTLTLWFVAIGVAACKDATKIPKAYDTDVVNAVVKKIQDTCIFPNDYQFLGRVAWVESKFGRAFGKNESAWETFRGHGGIWQVDPIAVNDSKLLNSATKGNILKVLGVNIDEVDRTKGDLQTPLIGGVVARSFLLRKPAAIPMDLNEQAEYWKQVYNSGSGAGSAAKFLNDVASMPVLCGSQGADVLFILDSSGSIGRETFELVKTFVAQVVQDSHWTIAENSFKFAIDVFSDSALSFVTFNSYTTLAELLAKIPEIPYMDSGTNMIGALLQASNSFNHARPESRGFPRVAVLVTDGIPNSDPSAYATALKSKGIELFTIGVGSGTNTKLLLEMASVPNCMHFFLVSSYAALAQDFPQELQARTCQSISQAPSTSTQIDSAVSQGQSLYFEIAANVTTGLTVKIGTIEGYCVVYVSQTTRNPSEADYDHKIIGDSGKTAELYLSPTDLGLSPTKMFIQQAISSVKDSETEVSVFVGVTGGDINNNFTLQYEKGNTLSKYWRSKLGCIDSRMRQL